LAPARPRAIGCEGAGGWAIASQARQTNFSRTYWITFHWRNELQHLGHVLADLAQSAVAATWAAPDLIRAAVSIDDSRSPC
jgi:hypothetical protein